MFGIGNQEMIIFLVIVLILFGPKNLPKLANSIGRAVRDFKSGLSGVDKELRESVEESEKPVETKAHVEQVRDIRTGEAKSAATEEKRD
ncbi:twin-arginine translocase TatA/TatE family subunit [Candidatus Sumerlaeota bacterium]|nr:twin-arginine translocase TatA/TatE family subunit [Candidatus Sumerlaeota bacterium]